MTAYLATMIVMYAAAVGFWVASLVPGNRGDMPTMWTRIIMGHAFYVIGLLFLILNEVTT